MFWPNNFLYCDTNLNIVIISIPLRTLNIDTIDELAIRKKPITLIFSIPKCLEILVHS